MQDRYARLLDAYKDAGGAGSGAARDRIGDIGRNIESGAMAHAPGEPVRTFPERHITGAPDVPMAPAIPTRQIAGPGTLSRAGRGAGRALGQTVRYIDRVRNIRSTRQIRKEDVREQAEQFIISRPATLLGVGLAGFVLGRLLRR